MPEAPQRQWFRVLAPGELGEGRVKTVTCAHQSLCLTRYRGRYAALDNACPHQGGPLGEGSIENGILRCPWHGWDFDPLTGQSPAGYDEHVPTFPVEEREDGVYVQLELAAEHVRTATDVVAETLVNWGLTWVFGMVGHSNLGLADALRRQSEAGLLGYVGIRHEGAASFACSAYGKLTGRPAACLAIAGPGATNLLTGLWDAHVDRAPVLALTGQVPTGLIGRGAFQEVDLAAAFGGVAVYTGTVQGHSDFAELASLASKHALVEQGVAHLIFPDDIQTQPEPDRPAQAPRGRLADPAIVPAEAALEEAVGRLAAAERPAIIVGHGARFAMDAVCELAEELGAPVLTTFKAKGQISDRHPLGCGVLGRSGTPVASWFMNESDLLLVFGASFSNHTGITPKIPTIQVDRDRLQLARFHPVEVPLWGDVGTSARRLLEAVRGRHRAADRRGAIAARWALWREEKARREGEGRGQGVPSASIFAALSRVAPANAILAVDVGNNAYSFGRYFETREHTVLMSGYLGSIGFGLPAAMGAWAASQEPGPFHGRPVVAVCGDGGLGQYLAEVTTLVRHGMNVTVVVLNNHQLGKITKEQRAGRWDVWQTDLRNPSFARYAELCGARGVLVEDVAGLEAGLRAGLEHDGPALVEILADPELI